MFEPVKLRIINSGVRIFANEKKKNVKVKCNWRLLREGLMSALPFINHQKNNPNLS